MKSNIRLQTNILCEEVLDEGGRSAVRASDDEICRRLSYIEFGGLNKAMPLRFSRRLWQDSIRNSGLPQDRDAFSGIDIDPVYFSVDLDAIPDSNYGDNPFIDEPADPSELKSTPANEGGFEFDTEEVEDTSCQDDSQETVDNTEPRDGQQEILTLAPDHSALVIAPPGTGKTHLLIEKVARLLNSTELDNPSDELLILSFTRAAVREVSDRLKEKASSDKNELFDYVSVRTFDSFAGFMLTYEEMVDGPDGDYDSAIKRLVSYIESGRSEVINDRLNALRYLVVDEIQDLSKDRATLVLLLAKVVLRNNGAILMLGDPCQAIYDWDVVAGETTSRAFLAQLRELVETAEKAAVYSLDRYFRYSNPRTLAFVRAARESMGEMGDTPAGSELINRLYKVGGLTELTDLYKALRRPGRTAILCRSNVEVHDLTLWLKRNGEDAYSDEGARGVGWPGWIAGSLIGWESDRISLDKLASAVGQIFSNAKVPLPDLRAEFETLDSRGHARGLIDLPTVFRSIDSQTRVSDERASAPLLVSTVHKSKGLEYDNVLLLEPSRHTAGDPEEVRIAYVAATRAKENFGLLHRDQKVFQRAKDRFRQDRTTRAHQYFFLGAEDFELHSMLSSKVTGRADGWMEEFRHQQRSLVAAQLTNSLSFFAKTIKHSSGRRIGVFYSAIDKTHEEHLLGFLSNETSQAIHRRVRQLGSQSVYIPALPAVRIESFAYPSWSDVVEKVLGQAGLVAAPVFRGFADFVPTLGDSYE